MHVVKATLAIFLIVRRDSFGALKKLTANMPALRITQQVKTRDINVQVKLSLVTGNAF